MSERFAGGIISGRIQGSKGILTAPWCVSLLSSTWGFWEDETADQVQKVLFLCEGTACPPPRIHMKGNKKSHWSAAWC